MLSFTAARVLVASAAGGCLVLSCTMAANPTELYQRGLKEAGAAQWEAAGAERAAVEQQLREKQTGAADGGRGPVMVRYRDEMTDELTARYVLVSIDFNEVHARNKGAGDLRSPDFTQLWSGSLPAGDHVLVIEAAHSCKPGVAAHCAASQVRRSWSFSSEARTPTGLDVRAVVDADAGDGPARPVLEMRPH